MFDNIFLGLSLGILGSLHCIGMCGPLVLGFQIRKGGTVESLLSLIQYNIGKIVAYTIIGLVFGLLGRVMHIFISQQMLSILMGIVFILYFLIIQYQSQLVSFRIFSKFSIITKQISNSYQSLSIFKFLFIGFFNGFLPCGLVYTAAIAATTTGHIVDSIVVMAAFGVGTIPSLSLVVLMQGFINNKVKQSFYYINKYLILIVALLLIMRGLNLGIPYISPHFEDNQISSCCHK